jgi:quercetin dioxygenase-like cupin family protein
MIGSPRIPEDHPMEYGQAIIVDHLRSLELDRSQLIVYDREIGLRLLYRDPGKGAEHYLIRYPAGLKARPHRHTAAHTIVVLDGRLEVNTEVIGPGAYCHFPPREPMRHAPAGGEPCLFVILFHGPFDVEPIDGLS